MDRAQLKPFIALIVVQLCFASLAIAGKFALMAFPPIMIVAMRLFFASLFLAALALGVRREHITLRDAGILLGLSLLGISCNQVLFIAGLARTSAINASLLIATIPVFTTLFAILLKQESPKLVRLGGIAIALAGALTIIGIEGFELGQGALGNLFVTLNSFSYSMYLVLSRDVLRRYRSTTVVAWTFLFGALVVAPFGALRATSFDFGPVPASAWWAIAWIVLVPSVLSYSLNNYALKRIHSSTVATYVFLQPLFAIGLAIVLLGEALTWQSVLGGLLVLAGVVLVSRSEAVEPMATIPDEPQPRATPSPANKEAMRSHRIEGDDGRPQPESQEDHRR